MKRLLMAGIGAVALIVPVPLITQLSGWQSDTAVAQNPQNQQALQLLLAAEKQVITKDQQGKQKVSWQALTGGAKVAPGDVLKYTLSGQNRSDRQLRNITLNQPIPQGMVYVLKSVNAGSNTQVTYSIDSGRNFVANPTVRVTLANGQVETRPAPATAYTHIRIKIPSLPAKTTVKVSYQTQVR